MADCITATYGIRRTGKRMRRGLATFFWAAVIAGLPIAVTAQKPETPRQGKSSIDSSEAAKGKDLFNAHCALCHYDTSEAKKLGPGMKGIYARGKFANGRKVDDGGMTRWIQNGSDDMPPIGNTLKAAEIRALIAYIKTL